MGTVNKVRMVDGTRPEHEVEAALTEMNNAGFVLSHVVSIPKHDNNSSRLFFEGESEEKAEVHSAA